MASERKRKPRGKPTTEEALRQRTDELARLRQFVDESTFSDDERAITGEIGAADQHPGDVADFAFQRELMQTTRGILEEEAIQAREALRRSEKGQYGICAECGRPISPERLAARPHATLCIDCQREREGQREERAS